MFVISSHSASDCNHFKGAAASASAAEQFIHPYFETVPNERFLRAHVSIQNGGITAEFGLDPSVKLPDILAARLDYQLRRLRLNYRYAQEINNYLTSQTTGLHMCFDVLGADGVRHYLNRQASVEFAQFHANYWRPVLLLALANHEGFCAGAFQDVLPQARPGTRGAAVAEVAI